MREIKFRAWNDIDKTMIEWRTIKAFDSLLKNLLNNRVRNHSLMQYTGLKDKNGKEIYEGDIVLIKDADDSGDIIGCIDWNDKGFWIIDDINHSFTIACNAYYLEMEVIDNIYENPELIQVE